MQKIILGGGGGTNSASITTSSYPSGNSKNNKRFSKKPNNQLIQWILITLTALLFFESCQKEIKNPEEQTGIQPQKIQLPKTKNPYSLRNVQKAQKVINSQIARYNPSQSKTNSKGLQEFIYFKFDPNQLTGELFEALENDTTVKLLDIPFANASLYNETFALDEAKAEQLKDGFVYGVTDFDNAISLPLLQNASSLYKEFLDTLVLIPEEDTTLQFEAYRQAGATEEQIEALRFCLFKRPHGYVRYWDDELNRLEPVRGMQVWGLVFGIPIHSYTYSNGYYELPWRFSAGTIMGTHAKGKRVNVKPFNTVGGWVLTSLIQAFVVGSIHIKGWVGACAMRNDVNFDFYGHTQVRYWSQILNAYYFHDQYALADNIYNAPRNMICYAHWADSPEGDFGSASTPMLYHMTGGEITDLFIQQLFNNPVTGTLLTFIHRLLPDMTFRVCGTTQPQYYNSRLAQTAFHELGHASMYHQVGWGWYWELIWAELTHTCSGTGNPYCDGTYSGAGHVAVAESWAEFIGTNNALRRYPNGYMKGTYYNGFYPMATLIENEKWFFGGFWIPYGVYNDLMDNSNAGETWDNVQGASISQLYNAFGSDVATMCGYQIQFIQNNPQFSQGDVNIIFNNHEVSCY